MACPARLHLNVEQAYRTFRDESANKPRDSAMSFDAIHAVAMARGSEVDF